MPSLNNWYPPEVGDLPLYVGRVVCQRANCWWDSKQRRRYAATVITGVVATFLAILWLGLGRGLTVEDLVLTVIAPFAPALGLGIRQYTEHSDAATRLDKLKEHADQLWRNALGGETATIMTAASRALQDEILESRRRSPLVLDMIFRRLRRGYEEQMNHAAGELAAEAKQRIKSHVT